MLFHRAGFSAGRRLAFGSAARIRQPSNGARLATAFAPAPSALALWLGRSGLLPFVLGAVATAAVSSEWRNLVAAALIAYGALIVSFLGGLHWGLALRHADLQASLLAWGVVPSLLAWPALLMPPAAGLSWLGVVLIVCYAVDHRVFAQQGVSAWLGLRRQLTAVASLSCLAAAAVWAFAG